MTIGCGIPVGRPIAADIGRATGARARVDAFPVCGRILPDADTEGMRLELPTTTLGLGGADGTSRTESSGCPPGLP